MAQISVSTLLFLLLQIALSPQYAAGYANGAPSEKCQSMIPDHGVDPQTGPNPYKLKISETSVQGTETVNITIISPSDAEDFKGFFIQVRKPGGTKPFGEFIKGAANSRNIKCEAENDAATHDSSVSKKSVTVQWIAPNNENAEYQVYYTVVKDGGIYWTHIPHPEKIRVTRNPQLDSRSSQVAASEELLSKWRTTYNGCGVTKGCFGMPGNCVEQYDSNSSNPITCDMMVTWQVKGGIYGFEMTGRPGGSKGYVAVGFSTDQIMGQDSVVGCAILSDQAAPVVQRYYNPGKSNELHSDPMLGLVPVEGASLEGNLFCRFTQSETHEIGGRTVDLKNDPHFLLLSRADAVHDQGLGKHEADGKGSSPTAIYFVEKV